MKHLGLIGLVLALMATSAHASTADEIAAIDAAKEKKQNEVATVKRNPVPFSLKNGITVDLNDYMFVVWIQQRCEACHRFNPILKEYSHHLGIKVLPYTLDGGGDESFPNPIVPRPISEEKLNDPNYDGNEVTKFFGSGMPIASPTLFLVNVNTGLIYPVTQGLTGMDVVHDRIDLIITTDLTQAVPHG